MNEEQLELEAKLDTVFEPHDFVFLSDYAKCWLVRSEDIVTLESDGNYTTVSLDGNIPAISIRRLLGKCALKLDPATFFRTGRTCIVNLNHVKEVRMFDPKRYLFIMANDKQIILSRQRSVCLRKQKSF